VVRHQVEGGGDPLSQLINITNLVKCTGSVGCDDVIRCVFVHLSIELHGDKVMLSGLEEMSALDKLMLKNPSKTVKHEMLDIETRVDFPCITPTTRTCHHSDEH